MTASAQRRRRAGIVRILFRHGKETNNGRTSCRSDCGPAGRPLCARRPWLRAGVPDRTDHVRRRFPARRQHRRRDARNGSQTSGAARQRRDHVWPQRRGRGNLSRRRTVPEHDRHQDERHHLSRRAARAQRRDGGSRCAHVCRRGQRGRPHQRRKGARARREFYRARPGIARRADDRGVRSPARTSASSVQGPRQTRPWCGRSTCSSTTSTAPSSSIRAD